MTLVKRFTRLVKADLHGILDCLEEPESLLKQAVREMEEELESKNQEIRRLEEKEKTLKEFSINRSKFFEKIQEEVELCINSGNDDLARSKIKRRLETEKEIHEAQHLQEENSKKLKEARESVKSMASRYESLKQKMQIFVSEKNEHEAGNIISDEDIQVAFLKEKARLNSSSKTKEGL